MSRNGVIVLIGLGSLAAVAAGCNGGGSSQARADVAALRADIAALQAAHVRDSTYLAQSRAFTAQLYTTVCELVKYTPGGSQVRNVDEICPGGPTEVKGPPPYPLP
jgi:hypothetical protein